MPPLNLTFPESPAQLVYKKFVVKTTAEEKELTERIARFKPQDLIPCTDYAAMYAHFIHSSNADTQTFFKKHWKTYISKMPHVVINLKFTEINSFFDKEPTDVLKKPIKKVSITRALEIATTMLGPDKYNLPHLYIFTKNKEKKLSFVWYDENAKIFKRLRFIGLTWDIKILACDHFSLNKLTHIYNQINISRYILTKILCSDLHLDTVSGCPRDIVLTPFLRSFFADSLSKTPPKLKVSIASSGGGGTGIASLGPVLAPAPGAAAPALAPASGVAGPAAALTADQIRASDAVAAGVDRKLLRLQVEIAKAKQTADTAAEVAATADQVKLQATLAAFKANKNTATLAALQHAQ